MGFQRNTQKPKENLNFSWSGAAWARAWEIFFRDFSLLGTLWATSGHILATLARQSCRFGDLGAASCLFGDFGVPESPKVGIFDTFPVTFRGPGAHARTELSLQSQHDLAGSGISKNRCFLLFPWGREKKGYMTGFFSGFL